MRRAALVALVLLAPSALAFGLGCAVPCGYAEVASATEACRMAVPCGYVYPLIRIDLEKTAAPYPLPEAGGLDLEATVTFTFDAYGEGAGPEEPGKPIVVSFEYPKKPKWVEITTDPETLQVPIQPQYFQPDPSDPNDVKVHYVYTAPVKIHVEIVGDPVLRTGAGFAKLLVFAKSTESGLYKPAYGIKELRVVPEGATFEDVDTAASAPPAPRVALAAAERSLGAATLRFVPQAEQADLWTPTPLSVQLDPPQPAEVSASLVDERGRVLYATGPRVTRDGALAFNLTFPEPGAYLVLASAAPLPLTRDPWPPSTVGFRVATAPVDGPVRLPQTFKAVFSEAVTEVRGDAGDPAAQFEKFAPLPVYEDASSGTLAVTLRTSGLVGASGGAGNLNVQLLDPNGAVVAQGVVDMLNPVKSIPVSGFPGTGLYQVRLFGAGANPLGAEGATVDIVATVNYDGRPVLDDVGDGRLDAPTTVARYGRLNATLDAPFSPPPWTSAPFEATLAFAEGPLESYAYTTTVLDPEGTSHLATAARGAGSALAAPLTLSDAGRFLVVFTVTSPDRDFQPTPLAFVVRSGDPDAPTVELPASYALDAEAAFDASPVPRPVASFLVPVREGATSVAVEAAGATLQVRDEDGAVEKAAEGTLDLADLGPGLHRVEVLAGGPSGGSVAFGATAAYPGPVTVANPDAPAPAAPTENGVPATGLLAVLLAVGLVASARRR